MPYISDLTGKPVSDLDGKRLGNLIDLIAAATGNMPHPRIVAIAVRQRSTTILLPITCVAALFAPAVPLNRSESQLPAYIARDQDIFLSRDVLDKQIIDTNGVRVVRVNDIEVGRANGDVYVMNVDIGGIGLMRRLGMARVVEAIAGVFGKKLRSNTIAWDDVELLPGAQSMRLKVASEKVTELHSADLAEIISDLNRVDGSKLLDSLDIPTLADTLEAVEPDFQASLVKTMPDDRVADVLDEMAPDEAADLLAELPEERSQELLTLMEPEEAQDVRKLLAYPDNCAGGIMTTEFISIRPDLSAEQALNVLRETAHEAETIFYVYVTDDQEHLVGVLSLRDLVLARPSAPIQEFMHKRMVSVNVTTNQDDCAQVIAKYNLLAVPVVDDDNRLHGIVTADDALDKIIPTAWKKRLPRIYD